MKIETKFNIGNKVWIVRDLKNHIQLSASSIEYITVDNEGLIYGMKNGDEAIEGQLINYSDKDLLHNTISGISTVQNNQEHIED